MTLGKAKLEHGDLVMVGTTTYIFLYWGSPLLMWDCATLMHASGRMHYMERDCDCVVLSRVSDALG